MDRKFPLALVLTLVLAAAPSLGGTSSDPEISDARGDVNAQHALEIAPPEEASDLDGAPLDQLGDIVKAWVDTETRESFRITVELANIPDDIEGITSPLDEVWTHFTLKQEPYHAGAVLSMPAGTTDIQASAALYRGTDERGDLQTSVDPASNTVSFIVDKSAVGSPVPGDLLDRFYVTTHLPKSDLALDYAPQTATIDPETLDPFTATAGAQAQYGRPYAFRDFTGAVPSALTVTIAPPSLELQPGQQGMVSISLKNEAPAADRITLAVGSVPSDWVARPAATTIDVDPGKSRLTTLTVVPASNAVGQTLITLRITSDLGADEESAVSIQVTPSPTTGNGGTGATPPPASPPTTPPQPSQTSGSTDNSPTTGDPTTSPPTDDQADGQEEENGSPAPGVLLFLAGLAGASLVARSRRR